MKNRTTLCITLLLLLTNANSLAAPTNLTVSLFNAIINEDTEQVELIVQTILPEHRATFLSRDFIKPESWSIVNPLSYSVIPDLTEKKLPCYIRPKTNRVAPLRNFMSLGIATQNPVIVMMLKTAGAPLQPRNSIEHAAFHAKALTSMTHDASAPLKPDVYPADLQATLQLIDDNKDPHYQTIASFEVYE